MVSKEYFGEGKKIEFKREIPSNHEKFYKDIIAFSNSSGGKVILGIEDETNIVYGIGDVNPFKLSDSISNMISDACTPQIDPDISMHTVEGKTVLIIDVVPGKFRPYYIKSKGKETTAYIRINGTSRPADATKLKELELEGQNLSYDSMQDIGKEYDEQKALELCNRMKQIAIDACNTEEEKSEVKDMTIEKLEDFGVLCGSGKHFHPTHAFDLLTDNKNRYAKVQCALFKGTTRDIFIDRKEFDGPIYEQVDDAYQFILRHIDMGADIEGVYRNDVYELPIKALREMVANAIAHRSYLDKSCTQVSIYDDRVEVSSPGMLYGGLDIETAKHGKSRCRNSAIAEAFHYMHIIEAWGTGIPRIINRCKEYGLKEPIFEEFGDGFRVTMFRKVASGDGKVAVDDRKLVVEDKKVAIEKQKLAVEGKKVAIDRLKEKINSLSGNNKTKENVEKVLLEISIDDVFGRTEIAKILGVSDTAAGNLINKMKEVGLIAAVEGHGKGKYKFKV